MKVTFLYDEVTKREIRIAQSNNCESVNPKDYYFNIDFDIYMRDNVQKSLALRKIAGVSKEMDEEEIDKVLEILKGQSIKGAIKENKKVYSQSLPEKVFDIFKTDKKGKHQKAFKNICLTTEQLKKIYFVAFDKYSCVYSKYLVIIKNEGIDQTKMPHIAIIEKDGSVSKYGQSDLTDGEIRQTINHRKCTRIDILDNNEKWYCFYWTWSGIAGNESSKQFDEHIHYIDYTWGLSRESVLEQLNSKKYSLSGIHIKFDDK